MYTRLVKPSVLHAVSVITRSFWVRFHMGLILIVVLLGGVGSSYVLLRLGVRSLPGRYVVAVVVGYGLFLLCVRLWLWYAGKVLPHLGREVVEVHAGKRPASTVKERVPAMPAERDGSDGSVLADMTTGPAGDVLGMAGDGCLVATVATLILAVVGGMTAYVLAATPEFLGEAIVQLALAAALRRKGKTLESGHWSDGVLRATWGIALAAGFVVAIIGLLIQASCPSALTLFDSISHCQ
jgi:hypothetical protein